MDIKEKNSPSRFALGLLKWFCPASLYEGIEGDLLEQFEWDVKASGVPIARRKFLSNVFRFFRPGILLRNKFSYPVIHFYMIGNYFKVSARNIQKRKLYSFINAFGLSIGFAFCMLIYLYIEDEKSFDAFHENKRTIYRIEEVSYNYWTPNLEEDDRYLKSAHVQLGLKQLLKDELPGIRYATRFNGGSAIIKHGEKVFTEDITYVDGDFFKMFSFPLLSGNANKLFENKLEVVITPPIAEKYFGDEEPVGKTLIIDSEGEKSYTVAGIIEAPPANSSLNFEILIPQENRRNYERQMTNWGNFSTATIIQLQSEAEVDNLARNLDKITEKHLGKTLEEWRKEGNVPAEIKMLEYAFTPLPKWHFKKEIGWHKVSDPQYSYILGGIAVLILVIAGINYISLALTTSTARRTEVGIRKVVGAIKRQLIYQFGFESILLAFISMMLGIGLAALFLNAFNGFTGKEISFTSLNIWRILGVGAGLAFIVGVLAGSYPAIFLSGFRPATVLKGGFTTRVQAGFTKPLVVLQFALSAFLIISSMIMYRQMNYITIKDLGYEKDQVLVVPTQSDWTKESENVVTQFRTRLLQEPEIMSVGGTNISFNRGSWRTSYEVDGNNKLAYLYAVDPYYIPTLNIKLAYGRNFDPAISADTTAVIVNEALVRDMKWSDLDNAYLNWQEDSVGMGAKVIGVVKDYHFGSLLESIEPMFLTMNKRGGGNLTTMLIKIRPGNVPSAMNKISTAWKEYYPDKPYDYTFLDEDVAEQYESQQRWTSIMGLSTAFAILISCLGLFGLAGINAVNRTKEIGIRKVMGAELSNIFILLNRQYIWLSLIAFALAVPFSWYVMDRWLSDFEFRIAISWQLVAVSIAAGLVVALLTVSYHAIKAALVNPAETLKYE